MQNTKPQCGRQSARTAFCCISKASQKPEYVNFFVIADDQGPNFVRLINELTQTINVNLH